jgi:hypothetical protein
VLLLSSCNTISTLLVPAEKLMEREREMMPPNAQIPFTAETLKTVGVAFGVVTMILAAAFVSLGAGVRRGSAGATLTALILSSILLLVMGLFTLLAGVAVPSYMAIACIPGMISIALLLLVIWLIGALRATPRMLAAQQQFHAQYWQYQQNMQAYQNSGYSAPMAPPPPPSGASAPPPPDEQNQNPTM